MRRDAGGELHAFLWEAGRAMQDLGTLGGKKGAESINDKGQIVGHAQTQAGEEHAFFWEAGRE